MTAILSVFSDGDAMDDLWWQVDDGEVRFFVNCNDFFYWACSDLEPIETYVDVVALRQAMTDAKATKDGEGNIKGSWWWPLLYCARRRGMRPQTPYFRGHMQENVNNKLRGGTYPDVFSMTYPYEIDGLSSDARALFDAAGPERDPKDEG